jgi:hypothetical protein
MAVGGIGPGGGAGSALLMLRLALRQTAPGAGAGSAAAPAAPATPDAVLQDVVARAQFSASLRVAGAAVEQVDILLQTYDAAPGAAA